jgi:hypothetical protein
MVSSLGTFSLTKWYLDCVDARGRVAIGYWASLAWRGLGLTWHSLLLHQPESAAPPVQRSSLARAAAPRRDGGSIAWAAPALGCSIRVAPRQPPMSLRLLDTGQGAVDWHCEAPAAEVWIQVEGQEPIRGRGYVERIVLTLPPWRLPIDQLRWGRWVAADAAHSLVWIDWQGALPRSWVLVDGRPQADGMVSGAGVVAGESSLRLESPLCLPARTLGEIVRGIAPLAAIAPRSLLALRQTRWRSAGTMLAAGSGPLTGWAIHELVSFASPRGLARAAVAAAAPVAVAPIGASGGIGASGASGLVR